MTAATPPVSAATDAGDFIADLDGGNFNLMLSIALSQVAAGVVDNDKTGKVSIEFTMDKIAGTKQVQIKHLCKFVRPTTDGKASEEVTRKTVMHVGKAGALTLDAPNQLSLLQRNGEPNTQTAAAD